MSTWLLATVRYQAGSDAQRIPDSLGADLAPSNSSCQPQVGRIWVEQFEMTSDWSERQCSIWQVV